MSSKFETIEYLKFGNEIQRKSYKILKENNIFEILENYNPLLAGTIPIEIDVRKSDLDIICEVKKFDIFTKLLEKEFSKFNNFKTRFINNDSVVVCNFEIDFIEIEIYASNISSFKSNAYRHMLIEDRIINLLGDEFKEKIINLKEKGLKTEPAFAKLLNLNNDPYEALLNLEDFSDEEIKALYIVMHILTNNN